MERKRKRELVEAQEAIERAKKRAPETKIDSCPPTIAPALWRPMRMDEWPAGTDPWGMELRDRKALEEAAAEGRPTFRSAGGAEITITATRYVARIVGVAADGCKNPVPVSFVGPRLAGRDFFYEPRRAGRSASLSASYGFPHRVKVEFYESGAATIIASGSKRSFELLFALSVRRLRAAGFPEAEPRDLRIEYVTAVTRLPFHVDVEKMASRRPAAVRYAPDSYQGIVIDPKALEPDAACEGVTVQITKDGFVNCNATIGIEQMKVAVDVLISHVRAVGAVLSKRPRRCGVSARGRGRGRGRNRR